MTHIKNRMEYIVQNPFTVKSRKFCTWYKLKQQKIDDKINHNTDNSQRENIMPCH